MKLIALGDVHGRNTWKEIVNRETDFDKFVFIGDYFDSFDIPGDKQLENYLDIIEFKEQNLDKVILLTGNHDYHYFKWSDTGYSGYQEARAFQIGELLEINGKYHQMCYINNGYLFTHAGVGNTWCTNNEIDLNNLEQSINDRWFYKPLSFGFTPPQRFSYSPYGDDITQTPIWIRPNSLKRERVPGYVQVVGHSIQRQITYEEQIYFIDTMNEQYLVIEDGKASTRIV
jgi:hypothetical protein